MRSSDDGETFGKPTEITASVARLKPTYDWQCMAVGPGHGLRLQNGRLVVAIWLSTGKGGHAHRPSVVSTIYSDDDGVTWQLGDIIANETKPLINPSESVLLEQVDGRVLINIRSESPEHRRAVASSPNGHTRWTEPRFQPELLEPICMANIIRWTSTSEADKNRVVFANPHNLDRANAQPGQGRDRKNLSLKLSYDEGLTWPVNKTLEAGPSAYCDLAVTSDGSLLCFYERILIDDMTKQKTAYLTLARVTLPWLTDGKDELPTK
jgi:sialidase-1